MTDSPYEPAERRPIAARRWAIWNWSARFLSRIGVTPNAISIAGMIAGILGGVAFASTSFLTGWERLSWLAAAAFIQLRLIGNLLDGMVAIESGKASPVGELYNEVPDRVSDAAILIGAGLAVGGDFIFGYTAAIAAVFTAYVRAMGKAAGAPQEYCGPMAKPHRMALMTIIALYCGLTPVSWQPMWEEMGFVTVALLLITAGCGVTIRRRLQRIAANLRKVKS